MKNKKKCVILLSGGLDSATTLYVAKQQGYEITCLIFRYKQRHSKEIDFAKRIAERAGCSYKIIDINLPWGGSSLIDNKLKIPKNRNKKSTKDKIPSTYVPARNTIFLAFALSCAEAIGAKTIFIGANSLDYSGYPDCRPEYLKVYQNLIKVGTKDKKIQIKAPLLKLTKAQIIRKGISLGVPYKMTWSCYSGGKRPCGVCDSCMFREKGFKALGLKDPGIE